MTKWVGGSAALVAAVLGVACGGGSSMTGPGMNGSGGGTSLPYDALEQHRDAIARFGTGMKGIDAIARRV